MNDMTSAIVPKSDQINADDLISGPRTIRIEAVNISPGADQPVSIRFEGEAGKVWRPCKSMSRVLVSAWGADAKAYVGRSVTLYRDPTVKWGGMQVGGIRISHMSDIDRQMTMALTETKGKRAPFVVKPLQAPAPPEPAHRPADTLTHPAATIEARADKFEAALRGSTDLAILTRTWQRAGGEDGLRTILKRDLPARHDEIERVYQMLDAELDTAGDLPGDQP